MKPGDLVIYNHAPRNRTNYRLRIRAGLPVDQIGLVLSENKEGRTLQIMTPDKGAKWYVTSCCKVINEDRRSRKG